MQQKYGTHLDTRMGSEPENYLARRGHHLNLHQGANEVTSWEDLTIASLEIVKDLWEQTRPKSSPSDAQSGVAGTELIEVS